MRRANASWDICPHGSPRPPRTAPTGRDLCPEVITNAPRVSCGWRVGGSRTHDIGMRGILVPGASPVGVPRRPGSPKTTLNSATQPHHRNRIPEMTPNAPTEAVLSNANTLMSVQRISKAFGDQRVLTDVSFDVVSGEILGLIGPNGAGKTTLLECIADLLPIDAGEVRWRGAPLSPSQRKHRLFYLPEAISPYPDQRSSEVLKFFRAANRQPLKRLDQLVDALNLEPALAKPVGALSKGYRRRLLLALGLLAPLPMLLMDEPFDGFDLRQTREVMSLLRDEVLRGRTLVLSIHQLADAQRTCDRLVLLSAGRVVGVGTSAELTASAGLPVGSDLEEVFLALA